MRLHVGCGRRDFGSDWIHIDCGNYPHVTSHNIAQLPFDNCSCSLIYASHVVEYFDREEIIPILQEWYRVLKPRSIIRLAVPNFEVMAKLYFFEMIPLNKFLGPLYGKIRPSNHKVIYHKTVYDFQSLKTLLEFIGFEHVKLWDWRQTEHSHIDDCSQSFIPHMDKDNGTLISLNIEGTKRR